MRFLKPATPDLKVPDPERGGYLPPSGAYVPDTEYWRRRGSDEVTDAIPPVEGETPEAPAAPVVVPEPIPTDAASDAKKKG